MTPHRDLTQPDPTDSPTTGELLPSQAVDAWANRVTVDARGARVVPLPVDQLPTAVAALVARFRTAGVQAGLRKAFAASPAELGRAAVEAARRAHGEARQEDADIEAMIAEEMRGPGLPQ